MDPVSIGMTAAGFLGGLFGSKSSKPQWSYPSPQKWGQSTPWLLGALQGQRGTGLQSSLWNMIYNPGAYDQTIWNPAFERTRRGGEQAWNTALTRLGRSNMQGGMANMYALANAASTNTALANLRAQRAMYGEQRKAQDIESIMNWIGAARSGGQPYTPTTGSQQFGNAILSALAAYGGMGGGQQSPYAGWTGQATYGGYQPYPTTGQYYPGVNTWFANQSWR